MSKTGPRICWSPGERCTLYRPGHTVHWIQAIHSLNKPRTPRDGRVVSIGRHTLVVDYGTEQCSYWNHATAELEVLVGRFGTQVTVDEGWSILRLSHGDRDACFSILPTEEPWRGCRGDRLIRFDTESIAQRILSHGGVDIPASR